MAKTSGESLEGKYPLAEIDTLLAGFGDASDIFDNFKNEVAFAQASGIITGDAQGNLAPLATLTRIQGAALPIRAQATIASGEYSAAEPVPVATAQPALVEYQDTDPHLIYVGRWKTLTGRSYSGGALAYTADAGASVTISFTGTALTWIAKTSTSHGKASVTLDGGTSVLVDLYSKKTLSQQPVYDTGILAYGPHTVRIVSSGEGSRGARLATSMLMRYG